MSTFFHSGRVDTSLYRRTPVDFTPTLGHGAIAEIVLGVMLGLAALTVLSLLWMALRLRWRGAFGRKSSAALRSLYPVVLGLGGYLLGVLVVLTTMPGVPLTDELLAALAGFGLFAPLLAIVGAAVGGNLILLVLDIGWDRQVRDRFVEASAKETLEAHPSTG